MNPSKVLDAPGLACIDLTPLIASTIRAMEPGQLLAVHTDDPAARVGVPAWCRLTKNRLVRTIEGPGSLSSADASESNTTFHILRRENRS